jgi:hypothetical protein
MNANEANGLLSARRRLLCGLLKSPPPHMVGRCELVAARRLTDAHFMRLSVAVMEYLQACLNDYGRLPWVNYLANVTPNGRVVPNVRSRNMYAYMNVLRAVADVVPEILEVTPDMYISNPPDVRWKGAMAQERPFATEKWHTDIWAGEPVNSATVVIPLFGDVSENSLELAVPTLWDDEAFVREHDSYEEGMKGIRAHRRMLERTDNPGVIHIFDSYVLHRTRAIEGTRRASIDFRVTYGAPYGCSRRAKYIPIKQFLQDPGLDLDVEKFLTVADTREAYEQD